MTTDAKNRKRDRKLERVEICSIATSMDPTVVLATGPLGSSLAVVAYDPKLHIGGILHYILPLSKVAPTRASQQPAMFGDTGIPLLLNQLLAMGASRKRLVIKLVGGAKLYCDKGLFETGKRNYTVAKKLLAHNRLSAQAEAVGGLESRSVLLYLNGGKTLVRTADSEVTL